MRINNLLQYATMIAQHRTYNPVQAKEETNKINQIVKEFETDQFNLDTIIFENFKCDLQDKYLWKKLKDYQAQKSNHRLTGFFAHRQTTFNLQRLNKKLKNQRIKEQFRQQYSMISKESLVPPFMIKQGKPQDNKGFQHRYSNKYFGPMEKSKQIIKVGFLQGTRGIPSPRLYI